MTIDPIAATGTDPLMALAEAMDAAVAAATSGAGRARTGIGGLWPTAGRSLSRIVYGASYAVSFVVVFPAVVMANAIPRTNAIVHGVVDGAQAAMGAVRERSARVAPNATAEIG